MFSRSQQSFQKGGEKRETRENLYCSALAREFPEVYTRKIWILLNLFFFSFHTEVCKQLEMVIKQSGLSIPLCKASRFVFSPVHLLCCSAFPEEKKKPILFFFWNSALLVFFFCNLPQSKCFLGYTFEKSSFHSVKANKDVEELGEKNPYSSKAKENVWIAANLYSKPARKHTTLI